MKTNLIDCLSMRIRMFAGIVLLAGLIIFTGSAHAERSITGATLDGASSVTVAPGASISAGVSVFLSWGSTWRCTSGRIGSTGAYTAVNHGNYSSSWGSFNETFSITAPSAAGTYDVAFIAYSDNGCSSGGVTFTMTNAVTVTAPAPKVLSINRASTNPTAAGVTVAWTVTFDRSVTGVNAADFVLAQAGGVSGASITQVSGSGTTWTISANTGSGSGTLGLDRKSTRLNSSHT